MRAHLLALGVIVGVLFLSGFPIALGVTPDGVAVFDGTSWSIDPTGAGDFLTLEEAFASTAVADGDTLVLATGVHLLDVTIDREMNLVGGAEVLGIGSLIITASGVSVIDLTIDGPLQGSAITVIGTSDVTLTDITITGGGTALEISGAADIDLTRVNVYESRVGFWLKDVAGVTFTDSTAASAQTPFLPQGVFDRVLLVGTDLGDSPFAKPVVPMTGAGCLPLGEAPGPTHLLVDPATVTTQSFRIGPLGIVAEGTGTITFSGFEMVDGEPVATGADLTVDYPVSGALAYFDPGLDLKAGQIPGITFNGPIPTTTCTITGFLAFGIDTLVQAQFPGLTNPWLGIPYSSDVTTGPASVIWGDDFESGGSAWEPDGDLELWHWTDSELCLPAFSGTGVMYFGLEPQCDYDTGESGIGFLFSPEIELPDYTESPFLAFRYYYEIEGFGFEDDILVVAIEVDGSCCELLGILAGEDLSTWHEERFDLSYYSGESVRIVFVFVADDEYDNDFIGWALDDVAIINPYQTQDDWDLGDLEDFDYDRFPYRYWRYLLTPEHFLQDEDWNPYDEKILPNTPTGELTDTFQDLLDAQEQLAQDLADQAGTGERSASADDGPPQSPWFIWIALAVLLAGLIVVIWVAGRSS